MSTHTLSEVDQLEADGLTFSGYLFDGRMLVPVLLRSQHSRRERRRRILRLNNRAEHVCERVNEAVREKARAGPEQLALWAQEP